MANKITVSWKHWKTSYNNVKRFKLEEGRKPNTVTVNGTKTDWKYWKSSYDNVISFKKKNKRTPNTVTVQIPSTITKKESKDDGIVPVLHFNQQNVGKGYAEYCCGVVSSLICASAYDVVTRDNFLSKSYGLIDAMKTKIGSGTTPDNMVNGFNKYFTSLKMVKMSFTESNIQNNINKEIPMVMNAKMNKDFGYEKFTGGHYMAITGFKNKKVGISDPHGFNLGRGYRYFYNYNTVKKAVDNNGSRPLYAVVKK